MNYVAQDRVDIQWAVRCIMRKASKPDEIRVWNKDGSLNALFGEAKKRRSTRPPPPIRPCQHRRRRTTCEAAL